MSKSTNNQQGFVSIVVCLIIMVILSLVTIGFAQIMSREQRQALDRQLSTQAFYAAESGVNDARLVKLQGYDGTCGNSAKELDTLGTVNETCVFVNSTPKTLKYDGVSLNPKVFPIHAVDASGAAKVPKTITITWSKASTINAAWPDFSNLAVGTWPKLASWNFNTGVGKVYFIPFKNGNDRATLTANTSYMLLYPSAVAPGTQQFSAGQGNNFGSPIGGGCAGSSCSVTVDVSTAPAYDELYLAISSLYLPSNFEVSGKDATGAVLSFKDVQAIVDSTGRTTDVLRRIEARVPLINSYNYPVAALTGDVCKLWTASPAGSSNAGCP